VKLLWLQSGGCGGCSLSLLGAEVRDLFGVLRGADIELLWHPSLSQASGEEALELLARLAEPSARIDGAVPVAR